MGCPPSAMIVRNFCGREIKGCVLNQVNRVLILFQITQFLLIFTYLNKVLSCEDVFSLCNIIRILDDIRNFIF